MESMLPSLNLLTVETDDDSKPYRCDAGRGTSFGEQNGEMTLHINYYEQQHGRYRTDHRGKCVCGLSSAVSNGTTQLRIDHDNIPRLYSWVENGPKHNTKIAIQLNRTGASVLEERIGMQPVSAVPNKKNGAAPRALTKGNSAYC